MMCVKTVQVQPEFKNSGFVFEGPSLVNLGQRFNAIDSWFDNLSML